jgi:DNA-binding PadR family transcriptional regulator
MPPTTPDQRGRHREHGGRPPRDRGPFAFGPFAFGGPQGPFGRFPFGRGPKARRGDVRAAALLLLAEAPRNGYQLMQEIESRSNGVWRPSPGSMYPVLQQLEDEGLVTPDGPEGRRVFQLTDAGRAYVEEHADELGSPWDAASDSVDVGARDLHHLSMQVLLAARQVAQMGSVRQVDDAEKVLVDTRRRLYRILAEDTDDEATASEEER